MRVLAVQRAKSFSPNSVEKDLAILKAVADRLRQHGCEVSMVQEEEVFSVAEPDVVLSMGRLPETLSRLKALGTRVVNSSEGIENCRRSRLQAIMEQTGIPMPPQEGPDGYWLKRADGAAQSQRDVVFAPDKEALAEAVREMVQRGITDYTVSAHVRGDLVKFYGVRGTDFFRFFYPTDDGLTKFDDERHNGKACHYAFDAGSLHSQATRLAAAVGIEVYGGDCIVRQDGSYCIIDFNDWPSFSRCREEAADAITLLVNKRK